MTFKQISCSVILFLVAFTGIVLAYDEALTVLDRLSGVPAADDPASIAAYRVYCLLALDRHDEARALIDRLLHQSPFFAPSADEAPPKIQTIFRDVRRAT